MFPFPSSYLQTKDAAFTEYNESTSLPFSRELPAHHGQCWTTARQDVAHHGRRRHHTYTHSLTINSAEWKGDVRDGGLIQHCDGMSIVWQGDLFISGSLLWLICSKHPPFLFTVQSFPLCSWMCLIQHLRGWAPGLILLDNRSITHWCQIGTGSGQ